MEKETLSCSFCGQKKSFDVQFFGGDVTVICENCLIAFHRTLVQKKIFYASSTLPILRQSLNLPGKSLDLLKEGYSQEAQQFLNRHFPRKDSRVSVHIKKEKEELLRLFEVDVPCPLRAEEQDAMEMELRRGLGLSERDKILFLAMEIEPLFRATFLFGKVWLLRLHGMTEKEAKDLIMARREAYSDIKEVSRKERIKDLALLIERFHKWHLEHFESIYKTYRFALAATLSGEFKFCRTPLGKLKKNPFFKADAVNLLALVETEDPQGKGILAAVKIIENALPFHSADDPEGKILRYNLAQLMLMNRNYRRASELLSEIFIRDWHFQDVRKRLAALTPALIEYAECSRNIFRLKNAVQRWSMDHGALPGELSDLVPEELSLLPTCPSTGQSYIYRRKDAAFALTCQKQNHQECEKPEEDHPAKSDNDSDDPKSNNDTTVTE